MNYNDCLKYLERLGNEVLTMKFGLENILGLLRVLGNPQEKFPAILIAGTNGKGSVARFLHSALKECGLTVGLFTSPHLIHVEERIVVNGVPISRPDLAGCLSTVAAAVQEIAREHHPTFFETITAAALLHFSRQTVDIVVLEVGMGGRLDSTNVYERPLLSIMTSIGMDHQEYLGDTLGAIAREKAGIVHRGTPVVSAPQSLEVAEVIWRTSRKQAAPLTAVDLSEVKRAADDSGRYAFTLRGETFQLAVYGASQVENAVVALEAVRLLRRKGLLLPETAVREGIEATVHPAVLQKVSDDPAVFIDGGHNKDAALQLVEFVSNHCQEPRHLVISMLRDKDFKKVIQILSPWFQRVFLTQVHSPRALSLEALKEVYPVGIPVKSPRQALSEAIRGAETVLATGSLYLAGELLRSLDVCGQTVPKNGCGEASVDLEQ